MCLAADAARRVAVLPWARNILVLLQSWASIFSEVFLLRLFHVDVHWDCAAIVTYDRDYSIQHIRGCYDKPSSVFSWTHVQNSSGSTLL